MLAHALNVSRGELMSDLPVPLRDRSARAMIALVRQQPGIDREALACRLNVKATYVLMLGARLQLEERLTRVGRRFWPPGYGVSDRGTRTGRAGQENTMTCGSLPDAKIGFDSVRNHEAIGQRG